MQLDCGQYLGCKNREIDADGLWLSLTGYQPSSRQPLHTHSNPTFFLQLSGDHCDETANGQRIQPSLTINFHQTTVPHRSEVGPAGMWGINLEISDRWLRTHQLQERDLGNLRILEDAHTRCLLAQFAAQTFGSPHDRPDLDLLVLELIEPFAATRPPSERNPPKWLVQVRDRILEQFPIKVPLTELADAAFVHPVYLCRAFRKHFGQSISEFVGELRMSEACRLLLAGQDAGSAALECGFVDQFHFSRALSKVVGINPRALKRVAALTS